MGAFNTPTESHFLKNENGGFVFYFKAAVWLYHFNLGKIYQLPNNSFFLFSHRLKIVIHIPIVVKPICNKLMPHKFPVLIQFHFPFSRQVITAQARRQRYTPTGLLAQQSAHGLPRAF
jgi:hypothetical protein